jgi:hypothetical protein
MVLAVTLTTWPGVNLPPVCRGTFCLQVVLELDIIALWNATECRKKKIAVWQSSKDPIQQLRCTPRR